MEFDFQYLIYKYTLAGAREKFEQICTRLLQRIHGDAFHNIRPSQGDGGIDGMVGGFPGPIEVYQCKYFPQGLGDSQKDQIRKSFQTALNNPDFTMSRWVLCIPIDMSKEERKWWDGWLEKQEDTGVEIVLWDGSYLLNLLRDQKLYAEVFGIEWTQMPELLTKWMVDSAKKACTADDVEHYHRVDHRFKVMLRVIAADRDVPHIQAVETVEQALMDEKDVILGGNSGMGKTSLMLRCAVQWVRSGRTALWLNLSERSDLSAGEAKRMREGLLDTLRPEDTALVCIDDPYEGLEALENLRKHFLGEPRIRLMVAERSNRLTQMTDRNADCFHNWLEDAVVVTLEGLYAGAPLKLGHRENIACPETRNRREMILRHCLQELEKTGTIPKRSSYDIAREVLQRYGKPNVTLVELIYRALFHAKTISGKSEDIVLDWDEWKRFIKKKLGKNVSATRLYGVIAACSVFDVPMTLKLFGRIFNLKERELRDALRVWKDTGNVEPVLYREKTGIIRPKHGVIAELFFLFQNLTPGEAMEEVLETMDENELEGFLRETVSVKWALQNGRRGRFDRINYDRLLKLILDRHEDGDIRLSPEARALALLGLIWCIPKGDRKRGSEVLELLEDAAPDMKEDIIFAKLYTEWGKLLADNRKTKAAEEKLCMVADQFPKQLHARTELGRLLSKQAGREAEAEQYLKEAIRIDPKNLHPHTELGRLLSKQAGREAEAEQYLKEAIRINSKDIQSRTELGRLLSKQAGREGEAEEYLKEAIRIDPKNLHPKVVLAGMIWRQRPAEAEQLYREVLAIKPGDSYAINGLKKMGITP